MSKPVLLLYGAGPNVGFAILDKFRSAGWTTAAAVRTLRDSNKDIADDVHAIADFGDHDRVQRIYADVEAKLGTPNVVIYNAYGVEAADLSSRAPVGSAASAFASDIRVNLIGAYAAATSASAGFAKLASGPKVFIYTGNPFPTSLVPESPGLVSGKAGAASFIEAAATTQGTEQQLSQWYYGDERISTGLTVLSNVDGEAHAEEYWKLANSPQQGPWNHTFVKGKGYVRFDDVVDHRVTHRAWLHAEYKKAMA